MTPHQILNHFEAGAEALWDNGKIRIKGRILGDDRGEEKRTWESGREGEVKKYWDDRTKLNCGGQPTHRSNYAVLKNISI